MLEIARSSPGECGRAVATYSLVPHGDKQRTRKTALFSMSRCRRAAWFDESRQLLARAQKTAGCYKARASSTETRRSLPELIFCRLKFGDRCFLFGVPARR